MTSTYLDFSTVTELSGARASSEQLSMIHTRYKLAYDHCSGKDVLDAACGPGRGLGFLAQSARSVVGGDCAPDLVAQAKAHYGDRIEVVQMDAQAMPWQNPRFDVVILFEALYYLPNVASFLEGCRRVLRPGGTLLLSSPNPEWPEFNPSPYSRRYYSASELRKLLEEAGFSAEIKAAFHVRKDNLVQKAIARVRKVAVSLNLIPKTMNGKAALKRIFYGPLSPLGPEIDTTVPTAPLVAISSCSVPDYKILYAIAQVR